MKKLKKLKKLYVCIMALLTMTPLLQSCSDDEEVVYYPVQPTALVTVIPMGDSFVMQLDDSTQLIPVNLTSSPFGDKEVRALVRYKESDADGRNVLRHVEVNWIDSIRTKLPVADMGEKNDSLYGSDPIEIVRDWVTVAEDGYLTLRIRTRWGSRQTPHVLNVVSGANPDNPFELELRHNANGDVAGPMGDALIAFNLNDLTHTDGDNVTLKLSWKSFSGRKSTEFKLRLRPKE